MSRPARGYGRLDDETGAHRSLLPSGAPPPAYGEDGDLPPKYSPFPDEQMFEPAPRYHDVWATVLFALHLVVFFTILGFGVPSLDFGSGPTESLPQGTLATLLSAIAAGAGVSLLFFVFMMKFARALITTSFIFNLSYNFIISMFFFASGQIGVGVMMLFFACIFGMIWWSWRSRIPFATVMLESTTQILSQFWGTSVAAVGGLLVNVAWICLWVVALFGVVVKYADQGPEVQAALYVFLAFSFYWTTQVISNLVHVTIAGTVATYYFLGTSDGSGAVTVPVSNPTAASFSRGVTTSFGPVAFASLLVSLLELARGTVHAAAQKAADDNNAALAFVLMCLRALLDLMDDLLRYFNRYALSTVAVYGESFCSAARMTWEMIKRRGIDAIVNDALVSSVLGIGSLACGLITASVTVAVASAQPDLGPQWCKFLDQDGDPAQCQAAVLGVSGTLAFFIGVVEFAVLSNAVQSAVSTTFVCLAQDPAALMRTKPLLFQKIRETYPQIDFYSSW